jgi:CRP/FNR family transcriptional regulator
VSKNPEPLRLDALQAACASCNLRELCLPMGLAPEAVERLDDLIGLRRRVRQGELLFDAGAPFEALFAIRSGFFKTTIGTEDGREQVTGFQMSGDLLGLDGIGPGRHDVRAVALEDSSVCVMPFASLERLAVDLPDLQRSLHRFMSREIVRDHGTILMLGTLRADQRLAAFLVGLLQRLSRRGYSSQALVLRMTRDEIGSYLGLKIETVSRMLGRLQDEGVIAVHQREVSVLQPERLRRLAEGAD